MKMAGGFLYLPDLGFQQVIEHNRKFGLLSIPKSELLSFHLIISFTYRGVVKGDRNGEL